MNKNDFIAKASMQIFTAMYSNPEKDPCYKHAVSAATDLWNELIANGIKPTNHKMTADEFQHAITNLVTELKESVAAQKV